MAKPVVEPEALSAVSAAMLLGVSRSMFFKMHNTGRVPRPVYLSPRAPRWRKSELLAWLDSGCPDRQTWVRLTTGGKGVRP